MVRGYVGDEHVHVVPERMVSDCAVHVFWYFGFLTQVNVSLGEVLVKLLPSFL